MKNFCIIAKNNSFTTFIRFQDFFLNPTLTHKLKRNETLIALKSEIQNEN